MLSTILFLSILVPTIGQAGSSVALIHPKAFPISMIHPSLKTVVQDENPVRHRTLLKDVLLPCQLEPALTDFLVSELGDNANSQADLFQVFVIGRGPNGARGYIPIDVTLLSVFETLSRFESGSISFETQTFGRNGQYTQEILDQADILYNFWQLESSEIGDRKVRVVALHSEDLEGNIQRAIEYFLEYNVRAGAIRSYESTSGATRDTRKAIEDDLQDGYSNAALTLNALVHPPALVEGPYARDFFLAIGDGILELYEQLGNANTGVDFLVAHEMAHVVQFSLDIEDANGDVDRVVQRLLAKPYGPPEELEADAMATYSLIRAQNYTVESLAKVVEAAEAVGDRITELPTHHGTPEQRSCAVRWAADETLRVGSISPREFRTLFQEHYSRILALDPSVCAFVGTPEVLELVECGSSATSGASISLLVFVIAALGSLI